MRIEATDGNEYKVWLTDSEIEDLRRATNSQRDDLIIQLGAFVGLRAFEIPQVRPVDVKQTDSGQYRLRVQAGKDTKETVGNPAIPSSPPTSSEISIKKQLSAITN